MRSILQTAKSLLLSFYDLPPNVPDRFYRWYIFSNYGVFLAAILHAIWILAFYIVGLPALSLFNIFSVIAFSYALKLQKKGRLGLSLVLVLTEITTHAIFAVIIMGWHSGFHLYILVLPIIIVYTPWWTVKYKAFFVFIICVVYSWLYFDSFNHEPLRIVDAMVLNIFSLTNIGGMIFSLALVTYFFYIAVLRAEATLAKEKQRSESLLHNILPVPVAERLKAGPKIIADGFKEVSILFLDIVDFTSMSEKVSAEKVVTFLNELFLKFDDLTEKYKLEKIKTIGDAYMVAAGIPEPCDDHAERIAKLAIDINESLKEYNRNNGKNINVRIGINSGSAVAGVIGSKKFAYDIWGDTVNMASRMEAYGEPGRIQVSENTYQLLKDKYDFIDRGIINVKGKGSLRTYFLKA